ncbi:MAG: DUF1003 domain-containing protein [Pyrinomonadaceae bacterium]
MDTGKPTKTKQTINKSSDQPKPANGDGALPGETSRNVNKIIAIERAQKQNRTFGEKISEAVAAFCGSMVFVYVHILWFGGWIMVNLTVYRFDPFPFTFLTLVVSLEAIFLSTFILISQNHETQLTERRNHLDLQINMLSEQENTKMLELLGLIAEKVGVAADDPAMEALKEEVDPQTLVEQIMSATGSPDKDAKPKHQ